MAAVVSAGDLRNVAEPLGRPSGGYAASTGGWAFVPDPGVPLLDATAPGGIDPRLVWATQPSVRKVVDFIARAISSTALHSFDRVSDTDRQRVTDGALAATLAAPAARVTPMRFWHSVIVDWLIWDRWAAMKVVNADRADGIDLVRLPARRFTLETDGLERVTGIKVNGREKPLDPASCLYDHGFSGDGKTAGTTPMRTLSQTLLESVEAVDNRRAMWKRGARIPAVIERPATPNAADWSVPRPGATQSARDRFIASWSAFTRGGGREGGTPILEDGMKLVEAKSFSPTDVRDVEWRQLSDAEVAAAFHIAPELVGARQGTYSNIEAYRQMLYGDALGPYFTARDQVVNLMLVPDLAAGRNLYVEANIDGKLRGSFEEQARVLSSATGRPWMTSAEARARANLPDLGGDSNELVTPLNVTVGGLASPRDTAPDPSA